MYDLRKDVEKIFRDSNLVFDDTQLIKSTKFTEVLFDWHSKKNLISTQNPQHFLKRDFYDSIMLSKFLKGGVNIDVGTGAGIPGLILSILNPDDQFILIDRREYPVRFLEHIRLILDLGNIEIIKSDAKDIPVGMQPETVIFKNFSNKKISGLSFEKKMIHINKLLKSRIRTKFTILVLTGSVALDIPKSIYFRDSDSVDCKVHELPSPFFDVGKYVLEMS